MIDVYNLTNLENNTSVFYGVGSNVWQTWVKPRGCTLVSFFVLGGGGAGGAGASSSSGTTRSGGAGGASGGISKCVIPAYLIPDRMYILVGMGGLGGQPTLSNGSSGSTGEISYVSFDTNPTPINVLLGSGNSVAGGGNGGIVGSSNAVAGVASTIFTQPNGLLSYYSIPTLTAGVNGGVGGNATQNGTSATISNIVTGGSGGAGVTSTSLNGANLTGSGIIPTLIGGIATTTQATNGISSFNERSITRKESLYFLGGTGGYSNNIGIGGNGGDGSYGCGGGGGGAGVTGGRGGNGGNGLIIITCY